MTLSRPVFGTRRSTGRPTGRPIGRRAFVAGLSALAASATGPAFSGQKNTIRIASEGAFPPYNFLTAEGTLDGFEFELGNLACDRAGLTCEWVLTEWTGIIPGLLDGRYDAIMAGMAVTSKRAQHVSFSRGYTGNTSDPIVGMFVATHSFLDPAAALIAVQSDTIHEAHLLGRGIKVQPCATAGEAFDAVLNGTADAVFGSPSFLEKRVLHTNRMLVVLGTETLDAGGAAIAFRKEDNDLRARFNTALNALDADGTLAALNLKWFTPSTNI